MDNTFNKDLVTALSAIPTIQKDASNPFYQSRYLTLDRMIEVVKPIFAKHGLAIQQNIWAVGDGMACRTVIRHISGEKLESDVLVFPCPQKDPQKIASLVTYLKRYQLGAFLGISTDSDDDANMVAEKPAVKPKAAAKPAIKVSQLDPDDGVPF